MDHTPVVKESVVVIGAERSGRLHALQKLLAVIAPMVEADGGTLELVGVDVDTGVVDVRLAGACGSCATAGSTLDEGVKRILVQRLDWVTDVRGTVMSSDTQGNGSWQPR